MSGPEDLIDAGREFTAAQLLGMQADFAAAVERRRFRYDQCDATCTTDCGHCKGQGRPVPLAPRAT
ncbi:hypothetical protein [Oerskovia paurometabola]|uniref:hypothetical protein n=1 Tax=Oerskovia paurometabola TaxID=162170 RepID=UPI0034265364